MWCRGRVPRWPIDCRLPGWSRDIQCAQGNRLAQCDANHQSKASFLSVLAPQFEVFQWHGDMFSVPPGARLLASSAACPHQAFQYGDHVLAMQFHLDYSRDSIQRMVHHCANELKAGPHIQDDPKVLIDLQRAQALEKQLFSLLDRCSRATT